MNYVSRKRLVVFVMLAVAILPLLYLRAIRANVQDILINHAYYEKETMGVGRVKEKEIPDK